jgi:hypothetical protein
VSSYDWSSDAHLDTYAEIEDLELTLIPDMLLAKDHVTSIAYLDGGTGSLLCQAAFAGLLAAGYFVKTQWAQVKATVSRVFTRSAK